jgi:hypothetical protein
MTRKKEGQGECAPQGQQVDRARKRSFVLLAAALMVAGCNDEMTAPMSGGSSSAYTTLTAEGVSPMQATEGEVARLVALALADPELRRRVRNDMRDAPMREHKLELSKYLYGTTGTMLRSKMVERGGISANAVLANVNALPPLEFYMPVAAHRKAWKGEADLIVSAQIEDTDAPIAWDLQGNRVTLSLTAPPATPVMVVVPVETDFSRTLTPRQVAARGNPSRETIAGNESANEGDAGAFCALSCGGSGGGGGGGGSGLPDGLYITFQRLIDQGEPWTLGAPEIEVHIHGPSSPTNVQYGDDLACSGDRVASPRGFNQDNAFWTGNALLFDQQQINNYNAIQQNGFNVMVWEDDNTLCQIKKEDFNLATKIRDIAVAVGGYTAVKAAAAGGPIPTIIAAATFGAAVYKSLGFLWTNDDFLGTYVNASAVGLSYTDANHAIYKDNGQINGRGMLVLQDY